MITKNEMVIKFGARSREHVEQLFDEEKVLEKQIRLIHQLAIKRIN